MSLGNSIKNVVLQGAHRIGLNRFLQRVNPQSLVLMYHGVVPDDFPIDCWTFVKQSRFRIQMEYLSQHFDIMSVSMALENLMKGAPLNRPIALVTFDDGYRNNYLWACPVMEDLGLPFIIFVVTDFVDTQNLFWFDKVIVMIQSSGCTSLDLRGHGLGVFDFPDSDPIRRWDGIQKLLTELKKQESGKRDRVVAELFSQAQVHDDVSMAFRVLGSADLQAIVSKGLSEIGSHTGGHEILTDLDEAGVVSTISRSVSALRSLTGVPTRYFSYPNGNYNRNIMGIVAQCGMKAAFITGGRHWDFRDNVYAIPRIGIGGYDSIEVFAAKVSGLITCLSDVKKAISL